MFQQTSRKSQTLRTDHAALWLPTFLQLFLCKFWPFPCEELPLLPLLIPELSDMKIEIFLFVSNSEDSEDQQKLIFITQNQR